MFSYSGTGHPSAGIVYLTGEHFWLHQISSKLRTNNKVLGILFGTGARVFLDDLLGGGLLILFLIELVEFSGAIYN